MYDDIVEVIQTSSDQEANKFLKEGWKIISVVPFRNEDIACPMYVLGKPSNVAMLSKLKSEFGDLGF
ncbi:hypothetical protein [Cohnella sp. AR92]|uniref:hypothetical protein n=1 Tax=Cohnella sp. AR92 TaxID=648716 RepID=UPI000F8D5F60|nr:hypothetical protein [Cohnella sp. AR92]RUS42055.1 hypothetical protein ELR57_27450 [Cohnella sp. AR92]RUS43591.1 hypothetical protein ELR57_25015 [Cohnella sp. AR92]